MSDFVPEVAKYRKSSPKPLSSPKWGSQKLCEKRMKFRRLIGKSGSESKNMTSDFALEVAK